MISNIIKYKTIGICAVLLSGVSLANTKNYDALDAYIDEKLPNFHYSERAKAVKNTLLRVQNENWWDSNETFTGISNELNHVLSCYFYAVGDDKVSLDLIDEMEFLVANSESQKKTLQTIYSEGLQK